MKERTLEIKAEDGFVLTAVIREPNQKPLSYIQINSGTGIPQTFYRHFAKYLTKRGHLTVTFDYRGIGKSKFGNLRDLHATNLQWGELDTTAILEWGIKNYPHLEKIVLGHSMGGQLIGLMKNANKIDKAYLIASGTGYWKDMPKSSLKLLMPFLWHLYIPFTTVMCGYGAAKKIKQGENLPSGVALQWRNWCINADYWDEDLDSKNLKKNFNNIKGPLKSISFTDDKIISRKANKRLLDYYNMASIEEQIISPSQMQMEKIGHFGFFSSKSVKLWNLIA